MKPTENAARARGAGAQVIERTADAGHPLTNRATTVSELKLPRPPRRPRQLLREVAYARLLAAIRTGELAPGERLLDSDLTSWLDLSRTPIREALSRLELEGLIETKANRFTRVAELSRQTFQDASTFLIGLQHIALTHAVGLDAEARTALASRAEAHREGITAHDVEAFRGLQDVLGELVAQTGNPLLAETERTVRGQLQFHAVAPDVEIDWSSQNDIIDALTALAAQDAAAGPPAR